MPVSVIEHADIFDINNFSEWVGNNKYGVIY